MTEIDNDKLLRDFFAENKQEIAEQTTDSVAVSCTIYPVVATIWLVSGVPS